jgi:ribosomal protein S27AE
MDTENVVCPVCGTPCSMAEDDGGYICENQACQFFFEKGDGGCGTMICPNCGDGAEVDEVDGKLVCVECGLTEVRECGCKV